VHLNQEHLFALPVTLINKQLQIVYILELVQQLVQLQQLLSLFAIDVKMDINGIQYNQQQDLEFVFLVVQQLKDRNFIL